MTDIFDSNASEEGIFDKGDAVHIDEQQKYAPERMPKAVQDSKEGVTGRRNNAGTLAVIPGTPTAEQAAAPGPRKLVAMFGDDARVLVASHVDGNQVEPWRTPTHAELTGLKHRGSLVAGSFAFDGRGPKGMLASAREARAEKSALGEFVSHPVVKTMGMLAGVALVGAGIWWWKTKDSPGGGMLSVLGLGGGKKKTRRAKKKLPAFMRKRRAAPPPPPDDDDDADDDDDDGDDE